MSKRRKRHRRLLIHPNRNVLNLNDVGFKTYYLAYLVNFNEPTVFPYLLLLSSCEHFNVPPADLFRTFPAKSCDLTRINQFTIRPIIMCHYNPHETTVCLVPLFEFYSLFYESDADDSECANVVLLLLKSK